MMVFGVLILNAHTKRREQTKKNKKNGKTYFVAFVVK